MSDVVHTAHPFELVICFELFDDAFAVLHLIYQLRKHFFCLFVDFGEVDVEGAVDCQFGMQKILVLADVGEIAFTPDADVYFGELEARDVIIAVAFVPQTVGSIVMPPLVDL